MRLPPDKLPAMPAPRPSSTPVLPAAERRLLGRRHRQLEAVVAELRLTGRPTAPRASASTRAVRPAAPA